MNSSKLKDFFNKYLWLLFLGLGIIGFIYVWCFMPHKSEIDHSWQMIVKILIFVIISLSVAFFPNKLKFGFILAIITFLIFSGYIIPRISYFGFTGAVITSEYALAGEFYTILYLILYPAIILTTCFAYRIGGGTPGNTLKISLSGVVILFSGFLDVLWYLVNPVGIPETIQYAHHIRIILGHYPTYLEAVLFTICHLPLLVGIIILPLDKWFGKVFHYEYFENKNIKTSIN